MHKKIDFCINSGQNGYFVLRLKKYLRNTKSSSVESFILALLWFNSQPEIENILSQATLVGEIVNNAWYRCSRLVLFLPVSKYHANSLERLLYTSWSDGCILSQENFCLTLRTLWSWISHMYSALPALPLLPFIQNFFQTLSKLSLPLIQTMKHNLPLIYSYYSKGLKVDSLEIVQFQPIISQKDHSISHFLLCSAGLFVFEANQENKYWYSKMILETFIQSYQVLSVWRNMSHFYCI